MAEPIILVAEDSADDRHLMQVALRRAGFSSGINFVHDGHEAVEYMEGEGQYADRGRHPYPDIIISDVKMPRRTGLELLQWIRHHPRCSILPLILLSGAAISSDIASAYQLGANTYFRKPGTLGELVELFRKVRDYWLSSELPTRAMPDAAAVRV